VSVIFDEMAARRRSRPATPECRRSRRRCLRCCR